MAENGVKSEERQHDRHLKWKGGQGLSEREQSLVQSPLEQEQIVFLKCVDVYLKPLDFGERQHRSRTWTS